MLTVVSFGLASYSVGTEIALNHAIHYDKYCTLNLPQFCIGLASSSIELLCMEGMYKIRVIYWNDCVQYL